MSRRHRHRRRTNVSRRAFLAGASLLGVGAVSCGDPRYVPSAPFPIGVASGDASATTVVLSTRYVGTGASLRLAVSEGDEPVPSHATRRPVTLGDGGFVGVTVEGLTPAAWHRYVFEAVNADGTVLETSVEGRFRTAFAPDTLAPVTFGAVSCTKYSHAFDTIGQAGQRTDLDAFILLGDICYADGAKTQDEFRVHWGRTLDSKEYRALRASTSVVPLWDDHEVRNNWEHATLDERIFEAAQAAFIEHQPMRLDAQVPGRVWRKLAWGKTADLFVLDCRSERDYTNGHYLSDAQLDWLIEGVTQSQAAFKLILNTVPISSFDTAFFTPFESDMWLAFPEQRKQVLEAFDRAGVKGIVWVAGDFHLACVGRVGRTGEPGANQLEVLVGPGAQAPNALPTYPGPPQFDWSSGINNYTELHLQPASGELTIRYFDRAGRVFFERTYVP